MAGISRRAGIVLVLATLLVTGTLLYPFLLAWGGREPQLSAYGDDWNDLSSLRKDLEQARDPAYRVTSILSSVAVLEDVEQPNRTLLMVIGNEKGYSSLDLELIVDYVREGGNLLVAGDFDQSNQLSELFALSYDGHTLWDERYQDNISFIRVPVSLEGSSYEIIFNQPTALKVSNTIPPGYWTGSQTIDHEALALSSSRAWLDTDNSGYISPDDDDNGGKGLFPLIVQANVLQGGRNLGTAYFFSDASWLTNSMWGRLDNDNRAFFLHFISTILPEGGTVIFDESVHSQATFPASFYQTALSFYFTLSGETFLVNILKVIAFIIILYAVIYTYLRGKDPQIWAHYFRLDRYSPHPHHYSEVKPRLQQVFIDRIRIKLALMDMPPADQPEARQRYIQAALQRRKVALDLNLSQLLFDPSGIASEKERELAEMVLRWEP